MAEFEALEREIRSSPAAETLKKAADSPEGKKILAGLDAEKVSRAAREGDMQTLKDIVSGVLSTPEGQELARKIRKNLGK